MRVGAICRTLSLFISPSLILSLSPPLYVWPKTVLSARSVDWAAAWLHRGLQLMHRQPAMMMASLSVAASARPRSQRTRRRAMAVKFGNDALIHFRAQKKL